VEDERCCVTAVHRGVDGHQAAIGDGVMDVVVKVGERFS
jgi:hypothetical protein